MSEDSQDTIDTSGNSDAATDPSAVNLQSRGEVDWLAERRNVQFGPGETVSTPDQGIGVAVGKITENRDAPEDSDLPSIEASDRVPTYVVVTEDNTERGFGIFEPSDLERTEIETEVDAVKSMQEATARAETEMKRSSEKGVSELKFPIPNSWHESEHTTRVIALKAHSAMGGLFDDCVQKMNRSLENPEALCVKFFDDILEYPHWRGDSPLPDEKH